MEKMFRFVYILKVWWQLNVRSERYGVPEGSKCYNFVIKFNVKILVILNCGENTYTIEMLICCTCLKFNVIETIYYSQDVEKHACFKL